LTARRTTWGVIGVALVAVSIGAGPIASLFPADHDRTAAGPYDLPLFPTSSAPGASGHARLVFADSPFGVAVTEDGHARYDVRITAAGLPAPSTLGAYTVYVAWAVTPDLNQWVRLGTLTNGTTTVGPVALNKFLVVVSAESAQTSASQGGPTVLHGTSPSGYLQSFLSHPLFRNMAQ
jgi:hypothetical protein